METSLFSSVVTARANDDHRHISRNQIKARPKLGWGLQEELPGEENLLTKVFILRAQSHFADSNINHRYALEHLAMYQPVMDFCLLFPISSVCDPMKVVLL